MFHRGSSVPDNVFEVSPRRYAGIFENELPQSSINPERYPIYYFCDQPPSPAYISPSLFVLNCPMNLFDGFLNRYNPKLTVAFGHLCFYESGLYIGDVYM